MVTCLCLNTLWRAQLLCACMHTPVRGCICSNPGHCYSGTEARQGTRSTSCITGLPCGYSMCECMEGLRVGKAGRQWIKVVSYKRIFWIFTKSRNNNQWLDNMSSILLLVERQSGDSALSHYSQILFCFGNGRQPKKSHKKDSLLLNTSPSWQLCWISWIL